MPNCTATSTPFPSLKRRLIDFDFSGGCVSANVGTLLLRNVDRAMGLTKAVARSLPDDRQSGKVTHTSKKLLRQRIYALACGDEDLLDHRELREDIALQTAVETTRPLASTATLQRFEQRFDRHALKAIHEVLVQQFIASYPRPPKELVLDFDATDNRLFGEQSGRHYHHHYRRYCYLPRYVFCGDRLLTALLRPTYKGGNWLTLSVLKMLVKRLRQAWPDTAILYRGDSGFYCPKVIHWCAQADVDSVVGYRTNQAQALKKHPDVIEQQESAREAYDESGELRKWFHECDDYQARSWPNPRRLVVKAEHSAQGTNVRFVLTSLNDEMETLYSDRYCARGDMENRIKEQKWLFSDRNHCRDWWPNQCRVLLSGLAYTLLEHLRRCGLEGTEAARWQVRMLREKLLKIAAVVTRNTRRIKFLASSTTPNRLLKSYLRCRCGTLVIRVKRLNSIIYTHKLTHFAPFCLAPAASPTLFNSLLRRRRNCFGLPPID